MSQKDILKGFKEVKPKKYDTIPIGSYVRYFKDGSLKYGGFLKLMRHPDYMVLINFQKKVSWSVQFKDPSLRVWVRVPAPKKVVPKK
jgi:hypothetical protein